MTGGDVRLRGDLDRRVADQLGLDVLFSLDLGEGLGAHHGRGVFNDGVVTRVSLLWERLVCAAAVELDQDRIVRSNDIDLDVAQLEPRVGDVGDQTPDLLFPRLVEDPGGRLGILLGLGSGGGFALLDPQGFELDPVADGGGRHPQDQVLLVLERVGRPVRGQSHDARRDQAERRPAPVATFVPSDIFIGNSPPSRRPRAWYVGRFQRFAIRRRAPPGRGSGRPSRRRGWSRPRTGPARACLRRATG